MGKKQAQTEVPPQTKQEGKRKQKQQQQPQQQQQQRAERSAAGGMRHYSSYLQVLSVDVDHTSPSVLLFFNNERYLFNAGEGIQRLFREHKIKITQIDQYFITRVSTETLGGLPGMALSVTAADSGGLVGRQASCTVKGPPGLASYVAAFRGYINKENTVAVEEFDHGTTEPVLKTDVVSITPILVRVEAAAATANGESNGGDGSGDGGSPAAKRQRTDAGSDPTAADEQGAGQGGRQRPAGLSHPDVAAYAVQMAGRPGKFLPEKAIELGVRPGPLFGQLQRGQSVTTESGAVVSPADVMDPALPGPAVLLLDTPSLESMRAVAADERVRRFVADAASGDGDAAGRVCVAVHLVPPALAADEEAMAAFRSQLGPAWRHVVVTPGSHQPSAIPRATVFQAKLHALEPTCFPLFAMDNAAAPPQLPEAELEAAAAAAREAAAKEAAAAAAAKAAKQKGGKGGGGGGGGEAAAKGADGGEANGHGTAATGKPAAGGGGTAPAVVVQQLPPVLPLPPGSVTRAVSAVRVNLVPPARMGLEYGDVFRYDSSSKVLEDIRADPAYAPVLAAAAEVRNPPAPSDAAAIANGDEAKAEASAAAVREGPSMDVDAGASAGGGAEVRPALAAEQDVPEVLRSGDRRQAELTFLGTASSQPSKYRNVSGCYVDLFDRGGLLVDCGEDAMGQMKRRFGSAETERRLLHDLGAVWVSHMHADHHGGLYRLLEWRARAGAPPLLVIGPTALFDVLVRYSAVVPIQFLFLRNFVLSGGGGRGGGAGVPAAVAAALAAAKERLGLAALAPFAVEHIWDAHGLVLQGRAGWRLVFSGDTRPCRQTVEAARGATLLVHEATFEESMEAEARAKRHSTTAEAVSVGEQAGAYRTVLTHFSTRYPTLPELDLRPHPSVAVAMDLMSINLADLTWLPRLVRPMGLLFKQLEAEKVANAEEDDD
ncbi:hypothetical protein PLESTF_000610300 [Pleodorina starrii]|nr:hypothetical protein PLESTM_000663500 [Pleodorina starrii]GLC67814.1 hypothetical protein PLESTF_000610300 [Pleodorina starrii]